MTTVLASTAISLLFLAQEPLQQPQDESKDLLNIQLEEDVRVFTVMAAINAAGFDYEKPGSEMSEVRRAVRSELEGLDQSLLARLRGHFDKQRNITRGEEAHVAFTSLALILAGPPGFELNLKETDMPGDTWQVRDFQKLLAEFYEQAEIEKLWERYRDRYTTELAGYVPVLREQIRQTLSYFRIPVSAMGERRIILIPDLLNAHDIVNARNLERTYYVVAGPTDDPANNADQLRHEYLHTIVDPLVMRQARLLSEHEGLFELAEAQPEMRPVIQNSYMLMVIESLIEALELRLDNPAAERAERRLVELFREGLVLSPYFYRSLRDYETNELVALPSYLEIIFQNLSPGEVAEDKKRIREIEARLEQQRLEAEAEVEAKNEEIRRHNRRLAMLRESEQLIRNGHWAEAQAKLNEFLEAFPEDGDGLFYMGQVHSQTGRHEQAYDWYRRTSESDAEPYIRAAALTRMGRIAASQGEFPRARAHFQAVLAMEGDLRGADKEARQLIARLPEK